MWKYLIAFDGTEDLHAQVALATFISKQNTQGARGHSPASVPWSRAVQPPMVTLSDIQAARKVLQHVARETPVFSSTYLTEVLSSQVVLKAENLQRTGAFKFRGATNRVAKLGAAARHGVVAGSAGNHAQALALAARNAKIPCEIFVPFGASLAKVDACRTYGAIVHEGGDSLDTAVERALQRSSETGATFCHPFDDVDVIAGQGTLGLELVEQIPDLRTIVIPLGGGGLAAGTAIAVKSQLPNVRVVGVQVAACSPYVTGVSPTGPIQTLADGIAVKKPGIITGPLIKQWLDDILVVQEDSVGEAMTLLLERSKLLVEGGGAVGVAALIAGLLPTITSGTTCIVLSGGNMDLSTLSGLVRRFETRRGRRAVLLVRISDRPGGLAGLLSVVANAGANVIDLEHLRDGVDLHVRETAVNLVLEVKNSEHCTHVVSELEQAGYAVKKLSD